jgi:Calx-beta domain-containing protein
MMRSRLSMETLDDRIVPAKLSVGDAVILEGNAGIQYALVNVTLDIPVSKTVSVNYATANGTAVGGSDYVAASGTVTFAPGETSKTIQVSVIGDRTQEFDETFFIDLRSARGAKIGNGHGVVTIEDNEPRIGIYDVVNFGEPSYTFTVILAQPYDEPVTVDFATMDGTMYAGVNYVATSGSLAFAPGETTKTITVDVIDVPSSWQGGRYFYVQLSNPSANALLSGNGRAMGVVAFDPGGGGGG